MGKFEKPQQITHIKYIKGIVDSITTPPTHPPFIYPHLYLGSDHTCPVVRLVVLDRCYPLSVS